MHMSREEKNEYEDLMREACGDPAAGVKVTGHIGKRLHELLLDAEQAGRLWARVVLHEDVIHGHQARAKAWLKKQSVVNMAWNGKVVGVTTRVGVRKRSLNGIEFAQKLFDQMTWEELADHIETITTQTSALLVNKAAADRLMDLRDLCPSSVGPADAASQLGTTVDAWLATEAS